MALVGSNLERPQAADTKPPWSSVRPLGPGAGLLKGWHGMDSGSVTLRKARIS